MGHIDPHAPLTALREACRIGTLTEAARRAGRRPGTLFKAEKAGGRVLVGTMLDYAAAWGVRISATTDRHKVTLEDIRELPWRLMIATYNAAGLAFAAATVSTSRRPQGHGGSR